MWRGGGGRGRRGGDGLQLMMLLHLGQQAVVFLRGLPFVPWVTLSLAALNILIHFGANVSPARACISAVRMRSAESGDVLPLLLSSAFTHVDDYHLGVNMLSLIFKGGQLEAPGRYASIPLLLLCALLTLLTQALYTPVAVALGTVLGDESHLRSCAVGFSGVLFALKVILQADAVGMENIHGFAVPAKLAAWAELGLYSLMMPQSSFIGHLSGILAGCVWLAWERAAWPHLAAAVPQLRAALVALRAARIPPAWLDALQGGVGAYGGGAGGVGGGGWGGGGGDGAAPRPRFYGGGPLGGAPAGQRGR